MAESLRGTETDWYTTDLGKESSLTPRKILLIRLRDTSRRLYWNEYDKDSHECAGCGSDEMPLEVHHRDGDPFNNHLLNLIAVCRSCHKAEHQRRSTQADIDEWKAKIDEL